MHRTRLLRLSISQLWCATHELLGTNVALTPSVGSPVPSMQPVLSAPSLPRAATYITNLRHFSAAQVLMDRTDRAGGSSTGAPAAATPPQQPAEDDSSTAASHDLLEGEEGADEDAEAALGEAFERLIQAAFEMVQQGKPMEAEYVLSEGAKQAEEILGKDALEVAALYDQLCVIRFLHERMEEAAEAAQRALEILKEHDEGMGPATAIAATRYASTLLALGNPQEAQLYTARSIQALQAALDKLAEFERQPQDAEDAEELSETRTKFEIGLGESLFYHALAKQAQNLELPGVGEEFEDLRTGLQAMAHHLGHDSPLVAAALREHSRLVMAVLDEGAQELAEALYQQEIRLHQAGGDDAEQIAMTQYQCGTLQYVMGKYEAAADTLQQSLETMRQHNPSAEDHLLTVQQRLGMVLALQGQYERGRELLQEVAPALRASLGEGNPVSEELEFMLALISLKEMEADGVSDPVRRLDCVAAMERHLKELSGYGEGHMLVEKAKRLYEEAKQAASAS